MKHVDLTEEPKIVGGMMRTGVSIGDEIEVTYNCPHAGECGHKVHAAKGTVVTMTDIGVVMFPITVDGVKYVNADSAAVSFDGEVMVFHAATYAQRFMTRLAQGGILAVIIGDESDDQQGSESNPVKA